MAANGIYAALYKVRPDVLVVVSGFFLPPDVYVRARDYGTKVVILHTEEPYEHERELGMAPFVDLHVLNDPTNLAEFEALAPSVYIPHCYRPSLHSPGPAVPELLSDFAFVGTGYPSRTAFFEAMNLDGLEVVLAGNWEHLPTTSPLCRVRVARAGPVPRQRPGGRHLPVGEGRDQHVPPRRHQGRALRTAGRWGRARWRWPRSACRSCGSRAARVTRCCTCCRRSPARSMRATLLRWWLAHPDERAETALKARAAIEDRTFGNAAAAVLQLLDKE